MPDRLNGMERKLATIINGTMFGLYKRNNPDRPFVILINRDPELVNAFQIVGALDYYGDANRLYNQTIRQHSAH